MDEKISGFANGRGRDSAYIFLDEKAVNLV